MVEGNLLDDKKIWDLLGVESFENIRPRPMRFIRLEDVAPSTFNYLKLLFYQKKPSLRIYLLGIWLILRKSIY